MKKRGPVWTGMALCLSVFLVGCEFGPPGRAVSREGAEGAVSGQLLEKQLKELTLGETITVKVADEEIPDCRSYDLSESALCKAVINYEYDQEDRLVKSTEYRYADNNVPELHKTGAYYYVYDAQDRLVEKTLYDYRFNGLHHPAAHTVDYEVTRRAVTEYAYDEDGGYRETTSYMHDEPHRNVHVYRKDESLLCWDGRADSGYASYYDYDGDGNLCGERYTYTDDQGMGGREKTIRTSVIEYDPPNGLRYKYSYKEDQYLLWIDHLDGEQNRVISCYYKGDADLPDECGKETFGLSCYPGYFARFEEGRLIEEVVHEPDPSIEYKSAFVGTDFYFYEYDEDGNKIWEYDLFRYDKTAVAYHYLYDGRGALRKLRQRVEYDITGNWTHEFRDGSVMEIQRNHLEKITDISRYDRDGQMLYDYAFRPRPGRKDRLALAYTIDENGEIAVAWNETLSEDYLERDKKNGDFAVFIKDAVNAAAQEQKQPQEPLLSERETDGKEPSVYRVRKGDCLWNIAGRLLGEGRLWPEIYRKNRETIGEDPALIREGAVLEIPEGRGGYRE